MKPRTRRDVVAFRLLASAPAYSRCSECGAGIAGKRYWRLVRRSVVSLACTACMPIVQPNPKEAA